MVWSNQSAAFSSGKVRPNHETNINIIARRTGKDVNSHTVLDGIITTIMATIQRINIIGSREGSRNRRRLKANQTGKKFRVNATCRKCPHKVHRMEMKTAISCTILRHTKILIAVGVGIISLATLGSKNHTTNITKIVTQSIGIIIKRL